MAEPLVWASPRRMGGEPCIYGTRVLLATVLAALDGSDPMSADDVVEHWPTLTTDQVARVQLEETELRQQYPQEVEP